MDIIGLYTNIAYKEGMDFMKTELQKRSDQTAPTEFILKLFEIILYNNVFEFHSTFWKQDIWAAMGSKPIPPYANTFMASTDKIIMCLDNK